MPGKLYYFDLGGRAEGIRAMLGHANFEYEDVRLTPEQFAEKKQAGFFPLGSMPVWEEDGEVYCQSSAIIRFLGVRCNYYSADPMTIWQIDSVVDFMEDNTNGFAAFFGPVFAGQALTESAGHTWLSDYWDKVLPVIEGRLAGHGQKFIAGTSTPTVADFKAFQPILSSLHNPSCAAPKPTLDLLRQKIDGYPSYKRWVSTMCEELQAYMAAKPARPF